MWCVVKVADCKDLILSVCDHPLLSKRSVDSLFLCARAKLLACECLLHRTPTPPSPPPPPSSLPPRFCLTPVELAMDGVKLLRGLCEHVEAGGSGDKGSCRLLRRWRLCLCLLEGLKLLAGLQVMHGDLKEGLYYAREGARLARTLCWTGW